MTFGIWRFRQTGVLFSRMTLTRWALALSSIVALVPCRAQDAPPPAKPADVQSQDAIMHAIYDVISGPGGSPRDWNRFLSLFVPGARLIPSRHHGGDSATTLTVLSPQDYVQRVSSRFEANGFFEKEVSHTSETYGAITQNFSTYESRHAANDEKPFARGINSFQLFNDGKRWYVVTIYWDAETPANPIPEKYLKK
jgi:hypothetical protein